MRTNDLSSASSWEVWNGSGYTQSKTAPCTPVVTGRVNPVVTYNTYLKSYVMVWVTSEKNASRQIINDKFYFSTSPDLITWSAPTLIAGTDTAGIHYASLLDPTDTSMNFEFTGQKPYLYYTKDVKNNGGPDRNLVRVPIAFTKLAQ